MKCQGIWISHRWFDDTKFIKVTSAERQKLSKQCQKLAIQDYYVHVGPVDSQGRLPNLKSISWEATRAIFQKVKGARLWAWVGAPNADYLGKAEDTFDMADILAQNTLWNQVRELRKRGFSGVHFDFEPIADQDPNFLSLLESARKAQVGPISVACPQLHPPGVPTFVPGMNRLWSLGYYAKVTERSDQVCLMGYDTFQPSAELYTRYLAYQTRQLVAIAGDKFVVGIPTYEDNQPYHDPLAETPAAAIEGSRRGGCPRVAVYSEWTTDDAEWGILEAKLSNTKL